MSSPEDQTLKGLEQQRQDVIRRKGPKGERRQRESIPAVRHARRRPQVRRALQRPAPVKRAARPRQPRLHLHHPAPLLHAAFFIVLLD